MYILSAQGVLFRSKESGYHLRAAILEDHLEQDRSTVQEYGLDLTAVLAGFSCPLEGGGNVSGVSVVGGGPDAKDIFNRADGLDEILLDCFMELELRWFVRKTWTYIVRSRECDSRP